MAQTILVSEALYKELRAIAKENHLTNDGVIRHLLEMATKYAKIETLLPAKGDEGVTEH